MAIKIKEDNGIVKVSCDDCTKRGRRGAQATISATRSTEVNEWEKRHSKHK